MFETNQWDKAVKAAKEFDKIINNSSGMATLTKLSNDFAKDMAHSDKQTDRLLRKTKQLTAALNEQALASAGITQSAYNRVTFYQDELKAVDDLEASLQKQLDIQLAQSQSAELNRSAQMQAQKEAIETQEKLNSLNKRRQGITEMQGIDKKLKTTNAMIAAIDTAFGGLATKLMSAVKMLLGPLGLLLAFAAILKIILGSYKAALKSTMDVGLDASQRLQQIARAEQVVADSAKDMALSGKGSLLTLDEVIKSADALATKLGTLDVSLTLVRKSAELSRQLGISADEAGNILQFFTRIRKESPDVAATAADIVRATALQNRFNAGLAMKDFAANTANFAKSARTGADEMAKSVIQARQLGVAFSTISGLADNIVTNFEGALESQATIGAFAPGFDMTGLLVASQFGSDQDIGRELKSAVHSMGMEFDQMPRSFKLAIASSLGTSVEELGNLMQGENVELMSPGEKAMTDAQTGAIDALQKALVSPLDNIQRAVFGIWGILDPFAKKSIAASMSDEDLQKRRGDGTWLGMAANKELEKRTAEANLQKLKTMDPSGSPGYAAAMQAAYNEVRRTNPDSELIKDMQKQQQEFLKTFVAQNTGIRVPQEIILQVDGKEMAKATTRAAERGLGIPERW